MSDLDAVLGQLRQDVYVQRGGLRQLEKVIAALSKVTARGSRTSRDLKGRLSAAARERIAAAQRAGWAKLSAVPEGVVSR
jgi:hypothetical protein